MQMKEYFPEYQNQFTVQISSLKGGLLFYGTYLEKARPTKDIDFLGLDLNNRVSDFHQVLTVILSIKEDDGLIFDIPSLNISEITEAADYHGLRARCFVYLENARLSIQLDIGFGDKVFPEPVILYYPTFINSASIQIRAYSWETVIAEKFESIVKFGQLSSRMKDYYDIWFIAENYKFDGKTLAESVSATFNHRKTSIEDSAIIFSNEFYNLKDKINQWNAFLKKSDISLKISFEDLILGIQKFLKPIIDSIINTTQFRLSWKPDQKIWGL